MKRVTDQLTDLTEPENHAYELLQDLTEQGASLRSAVAQVRLAMPGLTEEFYQWLAR